MTETLVLISTLLLALVVIALVVMRALRGTGGGQRMALLIVAVILVIAIPLYLLLGDFTAVRANHQARQQLPELLLRAQAGQQLAAPEMEQLVEGLRAQLDERGDAEGWRLLGRLAWDLDQGEMAFGALQRAYQLAPTNPEMTRDYGRIMLMTNDPQLQGEGQALLEQLIADPNEVEALSVLAFFAIERGQRQQAIGYWQQMRERLPADDGRRVMIDRTLEQLATPPSDALQVSIQLAPELAESIPQGARLLVFAKAVDGPPMPLAVKQLPLANWPQQVELSDADAMMPELKLSHFPTIEITARITTSANVMAAAGDLEGRSGPLTGDSLTAAVTIVVDKRL